MGPVTRCADVATGHGVLTLFLDFLARLASASPPSPCISPRSRSFRLLGGNSQRWDVVRTRSSGSPPQTRKLTSLVPCSSWRLFTCPVFARDALRLRPTPQSSATSVRAAESSARTRTTVSRRPSSVRSTLPSATATSVAWSRRSSTTLAGESLLFCRRARRGTAIARRATWRGTVTRSEQSGFRLARGLRYGANRGGERTCVAQRQNAVAGMVAVEPCLGTKHGRRSAPETDTLAPPSQWCAARPCRLPRPVPLQDAH
jgi:hypothetical protein